MITENSMTMLTIDDEVNTEKVLFALSVYLVEVISSYNSNHFRLEEVFFFLWNLV